MQCTMTYLCPLHPSRPTIFRIPLPTLVCTSTQRTWLHTAPSACTYNMYGGG